MESIVVLHELSERISEDGDISNSRWRKKVGCVVNERGWRDRLPVISTDVADAGSQLPPRVHGFDVLVGCQLVVFLEWAHFAISGAGNSNCCLGVVGDAGLAGAAVLGRAGSWHNGCWPSMGRSCSR